MSVIISGTGLFTPKEFITNEELVESFNQFVINFNEENKDQIDSGVIDALVPSSSEFIKKASGIEQRYVQDKEGILDITRMRPRLKERSNSEVSILAEMAIKASEEAIKQSGINSFDIDAVICGCSNLQRAYPAVAIEVQQELGISGYAYDMNVACSSATFGIQNIYAMIKSGSIRSAVMINPEIVASSDEENIYEEGCLSIPDHKSIVKRPAKVKVKYLNIDGIEQTLDAEGLLAACVQHEIDHLNGILFVDHISRLKRDMILRKVKKQLRENEK